MDASAPAPPAEKFVREPARARQSMNGDGLTRV
jgi:hypothetical protein